MVRLAVGDAGELERLNAEFNGKGKTTEKAFAPRFLQTGASCRRCGRQRRTLAGFVCVQLKKSFCYDEYMPEITEVYVRPEYRGRSRRKC